MTLLPLRRFFGLFVFALLLSFPAFTPARSAIQRLPLQSADFVWLEAETAKRNIPGQVSGWGKKEFLSGASWLQINIPAERVDKELPAEGILLSYTFDAPRATQYEIWDRIGFEFVRSPFAWRIDGGEWKTVTPDALTTDLMAIDTWAEVAWLKLDDVRLTAGTHTLEIRLTKTTDDKGVSPPEGFTRTVSSSQTKTHARMPIKPPRRMFSRCPKPRKTAFARRFHSKERGKSAATMSRNRPTMSRSR
jgi:hypothetical protein